MQLLTAPWVLAMEGPPLEGGAVAISGSRIRAVGTVADLARAYPRARRVELDGCVLLPALVNSHAHLELTALGPGQESAGFADWVLQVIRRKRSAALEDFRAGVRDGARRCIQSGQGVVADVLSVPDAADAYPPDGPEVRVFPEVIVSRPDGVPEAVHRALSARPAPGSPVRMGGLSPHAPYTVCAEGYRACRDEAGRRGGRLLLHLAESREELEFCLRGTGGLVERVYGNLAVDPPPCPGAHPFDWLEGLGILGPRAILVHAVWLDERRVARLARLGGGVVLCPRSNRNLAVGRAPGRALLDAGLPVGLGTDSVLSGGDLDLWGDVLRAVDDYGWAPEEALRCATAGGARVLGIEAEWGTLAPGKRADVAAVPLGPGRDPWERALACARVVAVWRAGERRAPWRDSE